MGDGSHVPPPRDVWLPGERIEVEVNVPSIRPLDESHPRSDARDPSSADARRRLDSHASGARAGVGRHVRLGGSLRRGSDRRSDFVTLADPDGSRSRRRGWPGAGTSVNGDMASLVHWQCIASGRVQGVNYRARVAEAAERHDVVGYVANLRDGTVLIDAQGTAEAIDGFLHDVTGPRGLSHATTVRRVAELPVAPHLSSFEVRRG